MLIILKDSKQKRLREALCGVGGAVTFLAPVVLLLIAHCSLLIRSFDCRLLVHLLSLIDLKKDISLFLDTYHITGN